jgi:hypothetical protein
VPGTGPGREGAEPDHHREQGGDEEQAVGVEDRRDHEADRGELDEAADNRDPDVGLEPSPAPARDRGGDRDEDERRRDLAEADVDPGAHASTSSTRPWRTVRP